MGYDDLPERMTDEEALVMLKLHETFGAESESYDELHSGVNNDV